MRADDSTGRRQKAIRQQAKTTEAPGFTGCIAEEDAEIPCWDEVRQKLTMLPTSVAKRMQSTKGPMMHFMPSDELIFPLSSDHLIILLQLNVLRASIENRRLLRPLESSSIKSCDSSSHTILPHLSDPRLLPPALHPTTLQCTVVHKDWIDIVPDPAWRDNLIRLVGQYDEADLWSDVIGGLFDGFPDSEVGHRGLVAWSPPWDVSGWEVSSGFLQKWGWTLTGCDDMLDTTNRWRAMRGEEPLTMKS